MQPDGDANDGGSPPHAASEEGGGEKASLHAPSSVDVHFDGHQNDHDVNHDHDVDHDHDHDARSDGNVRISSFRARATHFFRAIVWRVRVPAFNVFFNFLVTLAIFPGVTTEMQTDRAPLKDWFAVILVCIFSLGDFIGRAAPKWAPLRLNNPRALTIFGLCRVAFIPLFILRAVPPPRIPGDAVAYIIVALMALTNGYVGTMAMMAAPSLVEEEDRETTGGGGGGRLSVKKKKSFHFKQFFALPFNLFLRVCSPPPPPP
jgi:hypothetical protein